MSGYSPPVLPAMSSPSSYANISLSQGKVFVNTIKITFWKIIGGLSVKYETTPSPAPLFKPGAF
jgi:hypothetical protein